MSQASLRRVFTQDDFDRFAALSGDDNPIHVDPDFSAATKFGRTVAHGVLLITVLTGLVERLRPGERILGQDVRFPAPTFAGEGMEFRVCEEGEGVRFAVTRLADGVTTCDGTLSLPPQWGKGRDGGREAIAADGRRFAMANDLTIAAPSARNASEGPAALSALRLRSGRSSRETQNHLRFHAAAERSGRSSPPTQPSPVEGEGLTRAFSQADIDALTALGGARPADGSVPIPLIGGLFSYILGTRLPGRGTNYLKQQIRYLSAAPVGEPLTAHVAVTRRRPDKQLIDLSTTCRSASGSLICEGRALVHAGDVAGAFD